MFSQIFAIQFHVVSWYPCLTALLFPNDMEGGERSLLVVYFAFVNTRSSTCECRKLPKVRQREIGFGGARDGNSVVTASTKKNA